jgi:hypothetical protein
MAVKDYVKSIAGAVFQPLMKYAPNYAIGINMMLNREFTVDLTGRSSYNNKIFYTASNIFVRKMIEAPIIFNRKKPKANTNKFYSKSISNEERRYVKAQSFDEVYDTDLNKLFANPNDYQSGMELMEDFWFNYMFGDGILYFENLGSDLSRSTKPKEIHSLPANRITIHVDNNSRFKKAIKYTFTAWNGEQIEIDPKYICHLKHWNPNLDDLKGKGVDCIAGVDISLSNSGDIAQGAAYVNGGRGSFVSSKVDVVTDSNGGSAVAVPKLSKAQKELLEETLQLNNTGAINNRKMTFTNGELVVTPYGDPLSELEIDKAEATRWKNIFAIVGIPWVLSPVGNDAAENSIKIGYKSLVTNLCISEIRKFDEKLYNVTKNWWADIIPVHDITEYSELSPDLKLMAEIFGQPILAEDERRKVFGYDELPNNLGKTPLIRTGYVRLSDVVNDEFEDIEPNATM